MKLSNPIRSVIAATALALTSFNCYAQWTPPSTVTEVYLNPSDGLLFKLTDMTNTQACTRTDRLVLETSFAFFDEAFALLLSALHADADVQVRVNGCSTNGYAMVTLVIGR